MIVRICKDGKLFYQDKDITDKLPSALHYVCELEEGVLFKDILLLVRANLDFLSPILSFDPQIIKDLVNEGFEEPDDKSRDLWHLETYWRASIVNYSFDETPELYINPSFHGIGDPTIEGKDSEQYALDLTPLNNMAHLPVRINNNLDVLDERKTEQDNFQFGNVLVKVTKDFSLFEFLYAIFYELSFHGGPQSRNKAKEDLLVNVKSIEDGTADLIPWDVVRERLDKAIKQKKEVKAKDEKTDT